MEYENPDYVEPEASDAPEVVVEDADLASPDDFPSYDDVDSDEGQAELPDDSFDAAAASEDEPAEDADGCAQ